MRMIDASAVRELLSANLYGTATWRAQEAERAGGDDLRRRAAALLTALADALQSGSCGGLLVRIARICEDSNGEDLLRLSELEWDLLREIGYSTTVSTLDDYLTVLVSRFSEVTPEPPAADDTAGYDDAPIDAVSRKAPAVPPAPPGASSREPAAGALEDERRTGHATKQARLRESSPLI